MQSLNFLGQKPTVNWFDFFVNSQSLGDHLKKDRPEPSVYQLLGQFCEQAQEAETRSLIPDILPNDSSYLQNKGLFLWQLSLATATHSNWDLIGIYENCALPFTRNLFTRFVCWTSKREHVQQPEALLRAAASIDIASLSPVCRFGLLLYCRCVFSRCLIVLTREKFPKPKPKATVSNPNSQTDPSITANEARKAVAQEMQPMISLVISLLKNWLNTMQNVGFEVPKMNSFLLAQPPDHENSDHSPKPTFDPVFLTKVMGDSVLPMTLFDLASYYFSCGLYNQARPLFARILGLNVTNCLWKVNEPELHGYCAALGLTVPKQTCKQSPVILQISQGQLNEEVCTALTDTGINQRIGMVHRGRAIENHPQLRNYMLADRVARGVCLHKHVPLSLVHYCAHSSRVQVLCQALTTHLNRCKSTSEIELAAICLARLSSQVPELVDGLSSSRVFSLLGPYTSHFNPPTQNMLKLNADLNSLAKVYLRDSDDVWRMTCSFDPVQLRSTIESIIRYDRRMQMSMRMCIPPTLETVVSRMNFGFSQDVVVLLAGKIDQLWAVGNTDLLTPFITGILTELGPHLSSDRSVQAILTYEKLRIELEKWHSLSHRLSDIQTVGQMTMQLEPQVKEVIVQGVNTVLHPHLVQLALAFLINTANWEFIVTTADLCETKDRNNSNRVNTYLNLARIIAGFAFANQKQKGNPSDIAHVMFNTLLPTMEDATTNKRSAQSSAILISRTEFYAIVKYIKEHTAISLLLAYFGRLFNLIYVNTACIVYENISWPAAFTDASNINVEFLLEILALTIDSGVSMTPSNAFFLRAKAEILFVGENYSESLQFYLQTLVACSESFDSAFPSNVTDELFYRNMIKCCGKLSCHFEEAALSQMIDDPCIYLAAAKAIQRPICLDAQSDILNYIWDISLFEYIINAISKDENESRLTLALRAMVNQELNVHNNPAVLEGAVHRRRNDLFMAMCGRHF